MQDEGARAAVLAALRFVDLVVVFDEDTPEELIRALKPDLLFKGADYAGSEIPGGAFVKANGGAVEFLPLLEGYSTTGTVAKVRGGRSLSGARQPALLSPGDRARPRATARERMVLHLPPRPPGSRGDDGVVDRGVDGARCRVTCAGRACVPAAAKLGISSGPEDRCSAARRARCRSPRRSPT